MAEWSDRVQAWGAAAFFAAFGLLPLGLASAVGGALGRAVGPRLGISRRARRNLALAFPALSPGEIERIVRGMWDNLGRVAAEYPHLRGIDVFAPGGPVEPVGFEHFDRALAAGRRMIVFSGHLANWELGPLASRQYGLRVANIYRALNNRYVDRLIARLRGGAGEYVPKGEAGAGAGAVRAALRLRRHPRPGRAPSRRPLPPHRLPAARGAAQRRPRRRRRRAAGGGQPHPRRLDPRAPRAMAVAAPPLAGLSPACLARKRSRRPGGGPGRMTGCSEEHALTQRPPLRGKWFFRTLEARTFRFAGPARRSHRLPLYRMPISLWVCRLNCHCGWARQKRTAQAVLAVRAGPSIGCSEKRRNSSPA